MRKLLSITEKAVAVAVAVTTSIYTVRIVHQGFSIIRERYGL